MLSKEDILRDLRTERFGRTVLVFDTIDSTNACAKALAEAGATEGTLVLAEHQTAGRGRLGRTWSDASGENLLCSIIVRPSIPQSRAPLLTFFAATAVAEAVHRSAGLTVECKWPNDLLLNGRKFCGILLESAFFRDRSPYAVIGMGINVNQRLFPSDLKDRATSLAHEAGNSFDRRVIVCALMESLEKWYGPVQQNDFLGVFEAWRSSTRMFGQKVNVTEGKEQRTGTAIELAPDGGLVVDFGGVRRTVYAADVTLAGPHGG